MDTYVRSGASWEINISADLRERLLQGHLKLTDDAESRRAFVRLLVEAKEAVRAILMWDAYPRFRRTPAFRWPHFGWRLTPQPPAAGLGH
jgi:hypothetical protein